MEARGAQQLHLLLGLGRQLGPGVDGGPQSRQPRPRHQVHQHGGQRQGRRLCHRCDGEMDGSHRDGGVAAG